MHLSFFSQVVFFSLLFAISLILSYLFTPIIRYVALKFAVIDKRNQRTIHRKVITKLGGIAIFGAFAFVTLSAFVLERSALDGQIRTFGFIMISATLVFFLGIFDDVWNASPIIKVVSQILAALIIMKWGLQIQVINTPWGGISLGIWSFPITLLFIVGITNAINLLDGMDGLAAGVVFIISLGLFFAIVVKGGGILSAVLAISLSGACLGFLRFNFFPAKIFMGDTGSLFLGFMLAVIAIHATMTAPEKLSFSVPLVALGLPIFDTFFVVIRRIIGRAHPFRADKSHIHHFLIEKGLNQVQSVLILYGVTAFFVLMSFCF